MRTGIKESTGPASGLPTGDDRKSSGSPFCGELGARDDGALDATLLRMPREDGGGGGFVTVPSFWLRSALRSTGVSLTVRGKSVSSSRVEREGASESASTDSATFVSFERTLLVLFLIGFACWLAFATTGYAARHAQLNDTWVIGGTRVVEVSIVPEDRQNLACASDVQVGQLRCKYGRDQQPSDGLAERNSLQPLNTVKNELFLAAGLWELPAAAAAPPGQRFTVVCNYHVEGVVRSVSLRWGVKAPFGPLTVSTTAGSLTDCSIPP
jgi:hypothetical protein